MRQRFALTRNQGVAPQSRPRRSTSAASQWSLMWWKFRRHRLAMVSGVVLICFYVVALFAEFFAPYLPHKIESAYLFAPPQRVRIIGPDGEFRRPFVYGLHGESDPHTLRRHYTPDESRIHTIHFFVRGPVYRLWGIWEADLHLFGTDGGPLFLLGTDRLGRDMLSRITYASRISLSIGLIGVLVSFVLGIVIGGFSGYFGGPFDSAVQRVIELLRTIPTIPLWMGLAAALPPHWPPLRVYFGITIILSLVGWTDLARVVRSKFLALRTEDFVMAARLSGASESRIVFRHLVPSFLSHIIAALTLAVPGMILGETALSFLGIGLRPPVLSWGVLLHDAQNIRTVALSPWLFWPGAFVVLSVLAFNFVGDGVRDAADPYSAGARR